MYIGPQGIVHGTYSTILNAGRLKLGIPKDKNLKGKLFVTSGLGGMSGAQGKAVRNCWWSWSNSGSRFIENRN